MLEAFGEILFAVFEKYNKRTTKPVFLSQGEDGWTEEKLRILVVGFHLNKLFKMTEKTKREKL